MDMPSVFHFGPVEIPSVYVRLAGIALTLLVIRLLTLPFT
jgi:hypothetical protein